jgi:hypothetical protein
MPVQITPGGISFVVPTVIGGHYAIQSASDLTAPVWLNAVTFEGDGTAQTIPVPGSPGTAQFFRVNGR